MESLLKFIQSVTGDENAQKILTAHRNALPLYHGIELPRPFPALVDWFHEIHEGERVLIPLFRSANSDLNTTLAGADIGTGTHIWNHHSGFWRHIGKFVNFKLLVKNPIMFVVGILEVFGEVSKSSLFSLPAIRKYLCEKSFLLSWEPRILCCAGSILFSGIVCRIHSSTCLCNPYLSLLTMATESHH